MLLCLATGTATAGEGPVSLSLASDHAWAGLAGRDVLPATVPNVELETAVAVMRWVSLDAKLVWSPGADQLALGARLSVDAGSVVMRARHEGGLELAAGTDLGRGLELELGVTTADSTDLLLKAAFRY